MVNKRLILLAAILFFFVIAVLIVLIPSDKKSPVDEPHPDRMDVSITNTEELKSILLDKQYFAVVDTLADHIKATLDPKNLLVSMDGKPKIAKNGNVTITLQVRDPDKKLVAVIDRSTYFDKVVISIPQDDYQVTIPIYSAQ